MIELFMEKELIRKIKIIDSLWISDELTSNDLAISLNVTSATIKADIKTINLYYCLPTEPLILSQPTGYSIFNKNLNKQTILKNIYNDSLFVRAACFYLKNDFELSEEFAQNEFISTSKAYELRKQVINFLKTLNISLTEKNKQKNELKIRFLMTFFQTKIGIDYIPISPFNKYKFNELFKVIENLENCVFSDYSKRYASILFQLDFDRRKKSPLTFDSDSLKILKKTHVYKRLFKPVYCFLESELHLNIQDEQVLYYMTILNVMNANYYDKSEKFEAFKSYVDLVKNSEILSYTFLVDEFVNEFGLSVTEDMVFESSIITFIRKCIFNLQTLIPEEHIELGNIASIPNDIFDKVKNILNRWNSINELDLTFSSEHIKYLCSRLYFLIRKKNRPKKLFLLTSFHTDYLLAKEVLNAEYGALVEISQFDPKLPIQDYDCSDLILLDTDYSVTEQILCKKLKISYVFDSDELNRIRNYLFEYDLNGIKRLSVAPAFDF